MLLREFGDDLEADVQRYYGIDIADLWRGSLSLRRLYVLIERLPVDSIAARRIASEGDDTLAGWTLRDVLLARVVDEIAALRWQFETALLTKHKHRRPPQSVLPKVPEPERSNVVPLVSAHQLGEFMSDVERH